MIFELIAALATWFVFLWLLTHAPVVVWLGLAGLVILIGTLMIRAAKAQSGGIINEAQAENEARTKV